MVQDVWAVFGGKAHPTPVYERGDDHVSAAARALERARTMTALAAWLETGSMPDARERAVRAREIAELRYLLAIMCAAAALARL